MTNPPRPLALKPRSNVTNAPHSSLDIVESLMSIDEKKQFLTQCQHSLHHFFQFSEFLHRPIQRVLKYPLLLRVSEGY